MVPKSFAIKPIRFFLEKQFFFTFKLKWNTKKTDIDNIMYRKWLPATLRSLKNCKNFFSDSSGSCSKSHYTGNHIVGDFKQIVTKVFWEVKYGIEGKPGRITIKKEINGQIMWLDVSKCFGSQCQPQDCQKILKRKCLIGGEDFFIFCGLLGKHELYYNYNLLMDFKKIT